MLPGALQEEGAEEEQPATAAGGGGGERQQAHVRTTLIFAWWRGDPRAALGGDVDGTEGVAGAEGAEGAPWPRPLMELPRCGAGKGATGGSGEADNSSGGGAGGGAAGKCGEAGCGGSGGGAAAGAAGGSGEAGGRSGWIGDLLLQPGEWARLQAEAASAAAGGGGGLQPAAEIVSPCWVAVAPGAEAECDCGGVAGGDLRSAPLPCLRFFLPGADAVAAAYPLTAPPCNE